MAKLEKPSNFVGYEIEIETKQGYREFTNSLFCFTKKETDREYNNLSRLARQMKVFDYSFKIRILEHTLRGFSQIADITI